MPASAPQPEPQAPTDGEKSKKKEKELFVTESSTLSKIKLAAFPVHQYALQYLSIDHTFMNQPFLPLMMNNIIRTFGLANLDNIVSKIQDGFTTLRTWVLAAQHAINNNQEVDKFILTPQRRLYHPDQFNDQGFHYILIDPAIKQRLESVDVCDAFYFYYEDVQKYPDLRTAEGKATKVRTSFC